MSNHWSEQVIGVVCQPAPRGKRMEKHKAIEKSLGWFRWIE